MNYFKQMAICKNFLEELGFKYDEHKLLFKIY